MEGKSEMVDVGTQTMSVGALRIRRKTRLGSEGTEETRVIYSGVFTRSRGPGSITTKRAINSPARMVPMSGVTSRLPIPLAGPVLTGTRPFTSPSPALEVLERGVGAGVGEGAEAGGEEGGVTAVEGLDDSGLGVEVEEQEPVVTEDHLPCRPIWAT